MVQYKFVSKFMTLFQIQQTLQHGKLQTILLQIIFMKNLCKLSQNIRSWNILGYSLLPSIQIAIIHSQTHTLQVIQLLAQLKCTQILYKQFKMSYQQSKLAINLATYQKQQIKSKDQIQLTEQQRLGHHIQIKQQQSQSPKTQKIILQNFDIRLNNCAYAIFLLHQKLQARVHLVVDQQKDGQISDLDLKQTKRIIQTLKRNKQLILINFNQAPLIKAEETSSHIQKFGLNFRMKERQIKYSGVMTLNNKKSLKIDEMLKKQQNGINKHYFCTQKIIQQIVKKYQNVFAIQINRNYLQMKASLKFLNSGLGRYKQIIQLQQLDSKKDLISYGLKCLYKSKQYLIASLMGTFTHLQVNMKNKDKFDKKARYAKSTRSIHWQVMELVNQLWAIQGDALIKDIDKMPLTYIQLS